MNILEASFMGVGLAMDALAVSLALGAVGWSCPKNAVPEAGSEVGTKPESDDRGWLRRMVSPSPTPSAPVCAVCHSPAPCSSECACTQNSAHSLLTWDRIALVAAFFGVFQALMPAAGWFGSGLCGDVLQRLGRIAAAALLAFVAFQMFREGFSKDGDPAKEIGICSLRRLVVLAFATSIDAFLVGVSYTCLGRTDILGDVLVIGAVTAAISAAGCICGRVFGNRFGNRSSIPGGLVLFGLALKIMFFG